MFKQPKPPPDGQENVAQMLHSNDNVIRLVISNTLYFYCESNEDDY